MIILTRQILYKFCFFSKINPKEVQSAQSNEPIGNQGSCRSLLQRLVEVPANTARLWTMVAIVGRGLVVMVALANRIAPFTVVPINI